MKVHHTLHLFHNLKLILSTVASTIEILTVASLLSKYGKLPENKVNEYTIRRGGSANG